MAESTTGQASEKRQGPGRPRDLGQRITLLLVASLTVMSTATIAPTLPNMAGVFRGTPNVELLTKLVVTMPALAIALCAPLAGAIIDRFGRILLLYASLTLYGLAGASGYVLDSLNHILASRLALGVAVAGTMTTVSTLAGDYYSGEARTRFAGQQSFFMSMGGVLFVGLGGLLAEFGWRNPFLVYLAGWVVLVPAVLYLREPKHAPRHVASGAAPEGALPVRSLALAYGITFLQLIAFYMTPVQLPFLIQGLGIGSSTLVGLAIVASSLAGAVGAVGYGRLRRGNGFISLYAIGFAAMGAGYAIIALTQAYSWVLVGAVVSGLGAGLLFPNSSLWVIALAPPRYRGRLAGGLTAAIFLGQFLSPVFVQPAAATVGLQGAFGIVATVCVLLAVVLKLSRHRIARAEERP